LPIFLKKTPLSRFDTTTIPADNKSFHHEDALLDGKRLAIQSTPPSPPPYLSRNTNGFGYASFPLLFIFAKENDYL
jgi:hypothetical protein